MDNTLYIVIGLAALSIVLTTLLPYVERKKQQKVLQEQIKKRNAYLETLKSGDKVILVSGFHGTIVSMKDTLVAIRLAKDVIVDVEKDAIMGKVRAED